MSDDPRLADLRRAMAGLEVHKAKVRRGRAMALRRAREQADTCEDAVATFSTALAQDQGGHMTYRALVTALSDRHRLHGILDDYEPA